MMAKAPAQINDRWDRLARQMIQLHGSCLDIAHDADDPDGQAERYKHFRGAACTMDTILYLASKMRRTAAESP